MPKPHKKKGEKRISFDRHRIGHLYEMALEHICRGDVNCFTCENLKTRIEKFLGKKEVKYIYKIIKKNGYCNKLK